MGILAEISEWPAEVYRVEQTDRLTGGPGGVSNRQALALAGRTLHLRDGAEMFAARLDGLQTRLDAAGAPAPSLVRPAPEPPANLRTTARTATTVALAWDPVTGAHRYDLRTRRAGAAFGAPRGIGTRTASTATALSPGTSYGFQVRVAKRRRVSARDYSLTGDAVRLAHPGPLHALTVKGTGAKSRTTYTAATDYTHDAATGVLTRVGTGSILADATLSVAYTIEGLSGWSPVLSTVTP